MFQHGTFNHSHLCNASCQFLASNISFFVVSIPQKRPEIPDSRFDSLGE